MNQNVCSEVTLAVDTKKYGIRIHKALFRQLGSPSQIQLLVNPEAKLVAIQSVESGTPGKQSHRIVVSRMQSEKSYASRVQREEKEPCTAFVNEQTACAGNCWTVQSTF